MSAGTIAPVVPTGVAAPRFRSNWIISRRDDLVWFIGSAGISYLALALMAAGFPITPIYYIWMLGVDGPHVIATVTRTYFDKQERTRLGLWLWMIVPFLLIGPAMVSIGQTSLFYLFAVCWQHYHIAKQHYGVIMLWKAKSKDRNATDLKLDRWFLLASTILPLAVFVVNTRFSQWSFVPSTVFAVEAAYVLAAVAYVGRQIYNFRVGVALNAPKLLLLGVLIPLQWLAFLHAASYGPDGILRAGITLGLFHSFQYHRLLWFHNRNRYQVPGASEKYGLASYFAKDIGYYLLAALGINFLTGLIPATLFPQGEWVKAAIWAFPFTHYVLDSKIWRVRGDKELAATLRLH
jgi:hypothetical protein